MSDSNLSRPAIYKETLIGGFWEENPVFKLLLGMCPTLAVTAALKPALTMGLSVIFVLTCANIVVSLMRKLLKPHLRILMFTLTISTFVTICDLFLKAYQPKMSAELGPYIPLIIVNCLIIGRAEACASKNSLDISIVDALAMGGGFTFAICLLAAIRELFGKGSIFDISVMPENFHPWASMGMPVGAFITLGLLLALINIISRKMKQKG